MYVHIYVYMVHIKKKLCQHSECFSERAFCNASIPQGPSGKQLASANCLRSTVIRVSRTLENIMGECFANEIVQWCGKAYEIEVTKMGQNYTHFFIV